MLQVVASFISLATTFLQKSECAHAATPPFKITTASLGCDFVLGTDLGVRASKVFRYYTSEQALYRLLRLFYKSQSALMPLLLLPKSQPLRWVVILFWGANLKISASKVLGCCKNSSTPLGVLLFLLSLSEGTRTRGRLETCRGHVSTRGGLRRSEGRVPPPAPRRSKLYIACSDFLQKSECAHAAAPPFKITTASLGCYFVLGTDLGVRASKLSGFFDPDFLLKFP